MIDEAEVFCIDVETTGVNWLKDAVFGVAVAVPHCPAEQLVEYPTEAPVRTTYFDVRYEGGRYNELRAKAKEARGRYVNHNAKFDLHFLHNDGVVLNPGNTECTMIRAALIDEHRRKYDLDSIAHDYLGYGKDDQIYAELADLFGGSPTRRAQAGNFARAPRDLIERYARRDAEVALRVWAWQVGEIERQELGSVWALEKRLFRHVYNMERHGIRVDVNEAKDRADQITKQVDRTQRELNRIAGFEVNPNPSKSISELFQPVQDDNGDWVATDGTRLELTPAGKPSINADALRRMEHPAAAMILRLRKLIKTRDTFINGHILGYEHKGRVHPNINQVKGDETGGTSTGRLSYTGPALQQIPSRDQEIAKIVRPIFLPDDGQGWSYGDLDQHELRMFYHYAKPPEILRRYRENPDTDGHQVVADLTGLPRSPGPNGGANAKQVNLSLVFSMGAGTLAAKMGLPHTTESFTDRYGQTHEYLKPGPEAQEIMAEYHNKVLGVREVAQKANSVAKARGYVKTIMGRQIRFPGGEFTHKASGLIYQASSADCIKLDICNICEYLEAECPTGHLLLSIHDEFSLSLPKSTAKQHLDEVRRLIQERPGLPRELEVPIRIDFSELAEDWWEATQKPKIHDS